MIGTVYGFLWGCAVAITVALAGFAFERHYRSGRQLRKCLRDRPWLIGSVHGTISTGRWTIWHNDICLQTLDHAIHEPRGRGAVYFPRRAHPLAWMSHSLLPDYLWNELLLEAQQPQRTMELVIEAPPDNACVCILPLQRLYFLSVRFRGLRGHPSSDVVWIAVSTGLLIALLMGAVLTSAQWWMYAVVPLGLWVMMEGIRAFWIRWSVWSQFHHGTGSPPYRTEDVASVNRSEVRLHSWFNRETVLASDLHYWIRFPTSKIESVRINAAGIEFRMSDLSVVFHREGFPGEEAWEEACSVGRSLARELPRSPDVANEKTWDNEPGGTPSSARGSEQG